MSEDIDLSQFHQAFFEEAKEHLVAMEELLLALDTENPDDEELNAIFRAAHSIKGSAGTFGFMKVQDVTHILESILDRIRNKKTDIDSERIDLFLEAGDILKDLIDSHENEEDIDEESANGIMARLDENLQIEIAKDSGGKAESVAPASNFGFFTDDEDTAPTEEKSSSNFGFFADDDIVEAEPAHPAPGTFGLFEELDEPTPVATPTPVAEPTPVATPKKAKAVAKKKKPVAKENKTIRVGVEKIDQLVNSIGEMVITQSVIALQSGLDESSSSSTVETKIDIAKLHESIHTLQRNVKDLQETIMSIRMVPVNSVFNRFPRLVRDMATKLGKDIDLVIQGETTELDKGLIEKLSDPLTHILRNSIDHGIETREERALTNKATMATVNISASQVAGNVVIEIIDDGRGLNRAKILEKAYEKGLSGISDDMPDSEVWLLIFAAGFSTADKVSELSGRGVGMDVVKKNISSLGGRVELTSAEGEGTKTSIYLPLTMAILNGMIIKIEGINYIVPMLSIIETIKPNIKDIKKVGGGTSKVMEIRGEHIPIIDLKSIFRLNDSDHVQHKKDIRDITYYNDKIFMLIEVDDKKCIITLDQLAGQQQVVIKNIEDNYRKVKGISGATILGDGNIALIIDINYFVNMTNEDLNILDAQREFNAKISTTKSLGAI
jgi:two-component system chemotaxis sensor kinase CheA